MKINATRFFALWLTVFFVVLQTGCGYDGPKMTAQELKKTLEDPGHKIQVIDVRPSKLFKKGHIAGAKNYPLENLPRTSKELAPFSGNLAIICNRGKKSIAALDQLTAERISAILVEGGMEQWEAAGYPVVERR